MFGTGQGYTVMEMLRALEKVSGKTIPYRITNRRPGDIASAMRTLPLRKSFWDGGPDAALPICAPTHGVGQSNTRRLSSEKIEVIIYILPYSLSQFVLNL